MLNPGDVIDATTTTLDVLIDSVYQRTASLATPGYAVNVIGPNYLLVQWPNSDAQIEIHFYPRSVYPDLITL
jgi:hypothetical protein